VFRPVRPSLPVLAIPLVALLVALLAPAARAAPLTLEPPGGTTTVGERIAEAPNGGALLLTPTVEGEEFLTRLLPDGTVDLAWGTGGWSVAPAGEWSEIAVDSQGRILLTGSLEGDLAVARLRPDGAPDPVFGTAGIAHIHLGPPALEDLVEETLTRVVPLPDGSVLAAGWADVCADACRSTTGVVVKLAPDGALDPSFGEGGFVLLARAPRPVPGHGKGVLRRAFALAVQPDGKILVGGNDYRLVVVVRLTASGAVDTSFGRRGAFFTAQETEGEEEEGEEGAADLFQLGSATSILVERSGRIVVVGIRAIYGVLPDGRVDPRFGGPGSGPKFEGESMIGGYTSIGDALLDGNGRIVLVGDFNGGPGIVRFLPDGRRDPGFGHRGLLSVQHGDSPPPLETVDSPPLTGLGLLPGGLLIAAGYDFFDRRDPHSKVLVLRRENRTAG